MKTVLSVQPLMMRFFGEAAVKEMMNRQSGFMSRARAIKQLKNEMDSPYSNVETRVAFIGIVAYASDTEERDDLIALMGISKGTYYSWKRDTNAYMKGELKVRTVVIRK
ncbi:hypothetical protein VPMG_00009 [Vibrio phage VBP32]|uniref:Uncharacterized protein n=2 Tax=Stoningtonvirus VBP47 TaxID=2846606 RepID=M4SP05_9CAUD|nr:hypothetical protein VPNG_00006 [Vibrio phage VBP47]YP_007676499.1 hypothetical protein VPMG_00009 [Vibrio phage VBP32]AGH57030.1 hypothetical protein VPNG_00006 [Vibrio phage VBP47]AGH57148.1 hypothetical protein VPMG_00009 [Vibrio phage VBP32]